MNKDVFRQRLDDEYDQNILITKPSVPFRCVIIILNKKTLKDGSKITVENALACPKKENISFWEEQYVF